MVARVRPRERVPGTCARHASHLSVRVSLEMGDLKHNSLGNVFQIMSHKLINATAN